MKKLTIEDLYSLESYAKIRPDFRARVIEHKQHRRLPLGENVMLYFEDRLTMHYQVQEMLRAERIFEEADICGELEAYNPLIPDGSNWKATMMIEYPDEENRREALKKFVGIENAVWIKVNGSDPVIAVADEDLARTTDEKTSAVHFLRFELPTHCVTALRDGASLRAGISHTEFSGEFEVPEIVRESLIADLD